MAVECSEEHISKFIECCNKGEPCGIVAIKFKDTNPFIYVRITCKDHVGCELSIIDSDTVNKPLEEAVKSILPNKPDFIIDSRYESPLMDILVLARL